LAVKELKRKWKNDNVNYSYISD